MGGREALQLGDLGLPLWGVPRLAGEHPSPPKGSRPEQGAATRDSERSFLLSWALGIPGSEGATPRVTCTSGRKPGDHEATPKAS